MVVRIIRGLLLLGGLGLLAFAAYEFLVPAAEPVLVIDETERELKDCIAGQAVEVPFRLHNPSRVPIRIVGWDEGSDKDACRFEIKLSPPIEVGPAAREVLNCKVTALRTGKFDSTLVVYYDGDGLREQRLRVHGEAQAAKKKAKSE